MANQAAITDSERWESAIAWYRTTCDKLRADPQPTPVLMRSYTAQQDRMMAIPAPCLSGVLQKLLIMWECNLDELERQQLVADMRGLITRFEGDAALAGVVPNYA